MTRLAHPRYCDEIAHQVGQLRAVVTSGTDLSRTVPTTPDWSVEQLVRHLGGALRWVALMVRTGAEKEAQDEDVPDFEGPEARGDAAALDAWLAESGDLVVSALREAGPDARVWSWAGVDNAGFWARRMTHEVTVHRADATLAAGLPYDVAPEVAADAVDEWLEIVEWAQRTLPDDEVHGLRGPLRTIHLHATDTAPEANHSIRQSAPSAVSPATRAVSSGSPSKSTLMLPRKMITAEKRYPWLVMSDGRVWRMCQVSVT